MNLIDEINETLGEYNVTTHEERQNLFYCLNSILKEATRESVIADYHINGFNMNYSTINYTIHLDTESIDLEYQTT